MKNISENGESVILKENLVYIIIDALYLADIKDDLKVTPKMDTEELETLVKEKAFPYCETPYASIYLENEEFKVESIKKNKYDKKTNSKNQFSSDTGVVLIFHISHFQYLIEKFSYDELTDSKIDLINYEYWANLIEPLEQNSIAAIIAPGIDSGFDFQGGGLYIVDMT